MADIFISYSSADESRVAPLANALESYGWSVWWDRTIPPGKTFDKVIEDALASAKCVVVLWSENSIISDWVKEEAGIGKQLGILVPAKIDLVDPPLGFKLIQAANLNNWKTETNHPEFTNFIGAITEIVGLPPGKDTIMDTVDSIALDSKEHLKQLSDEEAADQVVPANSKTKTDIQPEPDREPSEVTELEYQNPSKYSNFMKSGVAAGVIVLLILGIFWWTSSQQRQSPVSSPMGKLFVESVPKDAIVQILNITKNFSQGMELGPGKYRVEVAAEGYEAQDRWIEIVPGEDNRHTFELIKKPPELAKLYVKTVPENATVKIPELNQTFSQGMELKPGNYRVEVTAEGYEAEDKLIQLSPGIDKKIIVNLRIIDAKNGKTINKGVIDFGGKKVTVTNQFQITMRTGPGNDRKIIALLNSGQELELIESSEVWSKVRTSDDQVGYVLTRHLEKKPDGSGGKKVTVTNQFQITMRTGPGNDRKIIALLKSGQELELIESSEEWSKVRTSNDQVGYALTRYLVEYSSGKPLTQQKNK